MTKRGNIFADLGLSNPERELLKAQLTLQIYPIIKARGLTQARFVARMERSDIREQKIPRISLCSIRATLA